MKAYKPIIESYQKEVNLRVAENNEKIFYPRIILGSFPSWSVKHTYKQTPDYHTNDILKERTIPYYFCNGTNQFWSWYKKFIDHSIEIYNINTLTESLVKNRIGITDVIISCNRKGKSSLDKHLIDKKYNQDFFIYPKKNERLKLLCTSKGLMNDMLLNSSFFKRHNSIRVNEQLSGSLQSAFLNKFNGNVNSVIKPIFNLLETKDSGVIECLSIPSPGSPYRKLENFGFNGLDKTEFLSDYLRYSFEWFLS